MPGLAAILEQETALVSRLLSLLGDEQLALKSGHLESLEGIAGEKSRLIGEINAIEGERTAIVGPDTAGMATWLKANPQDKASSRLWQGILKNTRSARSLHEENGVLIDALLKGTNDALCILLQHQASLGLYGSDGQTTASTGGRIVDSA